MKVVFFSLFISYFLPRFIFLFSLFCLFSNLGYFASFLFSCFADLILPLFKSEFPSKDAVFQLFSLLIVFTTALPVTERNVFIQVYSSSPAIFPQNILKAVAFVKNSYFLWRFSAKFRLSNKLALCLKTAICPICPIILINHCPHLLKTSTSVFAGGTSRGVSENCVILMKAVNLLQN